MKRNSYLVIIGAVIGLTGLLLSGCSPDQKMAAGHDSVNEQEETSTYESAAETETYADISDEASENTEEVKDETAKEASLKLKINDIIESEDVSANEDKFEAFYNAVDKGTDDVTEMADIYKDSSLDGTVSIKRSSDADGFIAYKFLSNEDELFSVKNQDEIPGLDAEYIQFKDIDSDGNDEILVAYYTPGTAMYTVCEFYVYSNVGNNWQPIMTYDSNDGNINELLSDNQYSDKDIADVYLEDDGLSISLDEGEKVDGVYYPKGIKLLISTGEDNK